MATAGGAVRPRIRPRKIIERPRLTRMLDGSKARIRMLIGAAGYGKTTLAEQWAAGPDRRVGWVRCRRSSSDIAVISRQIAAAGATIIPDCDRRLEQRLMVTPDPSREADVLAEILAEDLADWPGDAWIIIDDYHLTMEAPAAERFVEVVVDQSPIQLLIASRNRPSWISSRHIVYGSALEIQQSTLAMSLGEADEVLVDSDSRERTAIVDIASGWPAVIGLAHLLPDPIKSDQELPPTLFSFFAEEVLPALGPRLTNVLRLVGLLPHVDRALITKVFDGPDRVELLSSALATGLIDERDHRFELHPLAARFFSTRASELSSPQFHELLRRTLAVYLQRSEWDAAFELVERHGQDTDVASVLRASLDPLLDSARLATLERWIEAAQEKRSADPYVTLARAEIALRQGRHLIAQSLGESAIESSQERDDYTRVRSALVSGRAAHAGSREVDAFDYYERALRLATSDQDRLRSLHGLVMSAAALERPDAHRHLRVLERETSRSDPHQRMRLVDRQLSVGLRFGAISHLADARAVSELLPEVRDPLARCSFRSMFSCALSLGAYYEDARQQALALGDEAVDYRLALVLPYGYATAAAASAGLHRYSEAHDLLDRAASASKHCHDEYGQQNVYAIRVRVLLQEGKVAEACGLEPPDLKFAIPSMRGEVLASRALALACIGRLADARRTAMTSLASTQAVEAKVLSRAVLAVCALRARETTSMGVVGDLVGTAFDAGGVDLVVTTYRACPDVLSAMLSYEPTREKAVFLLARAGDDDLASASGARPSERLHPLASLSPREREVCDLACHGLSNLEIARTLFITESTVKVHLHKIYDKTGVRSRGALALLLMRPHDETGPDS